MDDLTQALKQFLFNWSNEQPQVEATREAQAAYSEEFEAFWHTLSKQDRSRLENLAGLHDDYGDERALRHFIFGFKLGAQIMLQALHF